MTSKCTRCGACSYACPFGAIMDKSYILKCIDIAERKNAKKYHAYMVVAPSISSQFHYAKLGQVITGIKALGFHDVVEAASAPIWWL
jgi:ferredoxin